MDLPQGNTDLERLLRHADWLAALARRLVTDAAAEDLVQDTWVAALRNPPDPKRPARPWLATVARRLAGMRLRREGREPELEREGTAPAAREVVERIEQERHLVELVLGLDEPYRDVVLLRYYRGFSAARIARMTGVPAATVRTRLRRGLEKLRERLDARDGGRRAWLEGFAPLAGWKEGGVTAAATVVGGVIMGKLGWFAGAVAVAALVVWVGGRFGDESEVETPAAIVEGSFEESVPRTDELVTPTEVAAAREPVLTDAPERIASDQSKAPSTLVLRVIARDTREPLEGVGVSITLARGGEYVVNPPPAEKGNLNERLVTDAAGVAVFELPADLACHALLGGRRDDVGRVELTVAPLTPGERRELAVELPVGPDVHFVGRVLDDAGQPMGGLPVVLPDNRGMLVDGEVVAPEYARTSTDGEGYFELDGRSWARTPVRIDAPGFGRALVALTEGHETRDTAQVVHLLRAAAIEARVASARGPAPAEVVLRATTNFSNLIRPRSVVGSQTGHDPWWKAGADRDGRIVLDGLPPGVPLSLELRQGADVLKRVAEEIRLEPGERRELDLEVGTGVPVEGIAIGETGAPVARLEVWLCPADEKRWSPDGIDEELPRYLTRRDAELAMRATTGEDGRFRFEGVEPGRWLCGPGWVDVEKAANRAALAAPLAVFVLVEPELGARDVVLEVVRGRYIEGRVLNSDGEPFGRTWVRLDSLRLAKVQDTFSDDTGAFSAGPLIPGEVVLQATGTGRHSDSLPVRAEPGDTEVVLRLVPAAAIRGRVVDPRTGRGCEAELRLIDAADPHGYERWQRSERENGVFALEKLEAGTYHLLARADDGGIALRSGLQVSTGRTLEDVELRLERGALLDVRSRDGVEAGITLYHDGLAVGHGFIGEGKASQQTVFPGVTRVLYRVEREPDGVEVEVDLAPGERRELLLPPLPE